jgi:hypothetical protein
MKSILSNGFHAPKATPYSNKQKVKSDFGRKTPAKPAYKLNNVCNANTFAIQTIRLANPKEITHKNQLHIHQLQFIDSHIL